MTMKNQRIEEQLEEKEKIQRKTIQNQAIVDVGKMKAIQLVHSYHDLLEGMPRILGKNFAGLKKKLSDDIYSLAAVMTNKFESQNYKPTNNDHSKAVQESKYLALIKENHEPGSDDDEELYEEKYDQELNDDSNSESERPQEQRKQPPKRHSPSTKRKNPTATPRSSPTRSSPRKRKRSQTTQDTDDENDPFKNPGPDDDNQEDENSDDDEGH
jgi:hypothetical protein